MADLELGLQETTAVYEGFTTNCDPTLGECMLVVRLKSLDPDVDVLERDLGKCFEHACTIPTKCLLIDLLGLTGSLSAQVWEALSKTAERLAKEHSIITKMCVGEQLEKPVDAHTPDGIDQFTGVIEASEAFCTQVLG